MLLNCYAVRSYQTPEIVILFVLAHMKQIQKNNPKEPVERLSSIMPNISNNIDQLLQDQEDDKINVKTSTNRRH